MDIENIPFNHRLFYLINHNRHAFLDLFYRYFHHLGKGWFGALVGVLFFTLLKKAFPKYLLVMVLQTIIVKALKYTIRAKRPPSVLPKVYALEDLHLKSFPSGDSATAMSIALCLIEVSPPWLRPFLLLYPLLIGYGRVYMGVHFPLDVVVGWFIGVLCFLVAYLVF